MVQKWGFGRVGSESTEKRDPWQYLSILFPPYHRAGQRGAQWEQGCPVVEALSQLSSGLWLSCLLAEDTSSSIPFLLPPPGPRGLSLLSSRTRGSQAEAGGKGHLGKMSEGLRTGTKCSFSTCRSSRSALLPLYIPSSQGDSTVPSSQSFSRQKCAQSVSV